MDESSALAILGFPNRKKDGRLVSNDTHRPTCASTIFRSHYRIDEVIPSHPGMNDYDGNSGHL
jgi:hypothetical protein